MRLSEVTVSNYRSIVKQTRFAVGDLTTLIGPNNEGKSNLLRALALGMQLIERWSTLPDRLSGKEEISGTDALMFMRSSQYRRNQRPDDEVQGYNWARDYPLQKQTTKGALPTTIRFLFELDETEVQPYLEATGIRNNGYLPIELKLGRTSISLGIVKPGRGAATHRAKAREIARFVKNGVTFVSIPAIRTGRQAQTLVNDLARIRLQSVARSEEYVLLANQINALRRAAVGEIATGLTESVQRYLPSVANIEIETADIASADAVADLVIDDGTSTSIDNKGDGIKSLVSMALLHQLASERSKSQSIILAVDEPEAHLHPASVHELHTLFAQISQDQQVILATHNPIFVNREHVSSNVLVRANEARPAQSVEQIRTAIGVQLHDNLESAEKIVLVEGLTDTQILPRLLLETNAEWRQALSNASIAFKPVKGVGRTRSHIQREKSTLCQIFVVVDGDVAGRQEAARIVEERHLPQKNVFILSDGMRRNSEIEDLLEPTIYLHALTTKFGRNFTPSHFKNRSKKWSDNFEAAAIALGVAIVDTTIDEAKIVVADAVVGRKESGLIRPEAAGTLEALDHLLRSRG